MRNPEELHASPAGSRQAVRAHQHSSALSTLAELYRSEARLLQNLTSVLRRQQQAIEADDLDALDDTVFATHRVLGTISEARRRRSAVHMMLAGVEELDSEDIDKLLGGDLPAELVDARAVLRAAALELSRQVRESRARLEGAVSNGDALIRSVYGNSGQPAPAGWHKAESAHGGILLNRTA